eukprot:XP_017951154.1 PREDICTED: uncharacterized protein LOC108648090 [Xenopus tropicalis]
MNVLLQLEQLKRETDPESGRVGVSLSESKSRFRSKSTFYPTHLRDNIVNMFQKNVETELSLLHEATSDLPPRNNLTMKEKRALNTLKNDHDIVIRKADKGGQIVILNKSDYVFEAHRQLSDRETYLPLEKSPLNIYASELDALLQEALSFNIIDDKLVAFIKNDTPKSAIFHHLPKMHKKERPPAGRPIIAGIGSLGENLCEFIDHFLQPLVLRLPSYLRDTEGYNPELFVEKWLQDLLGTENFSAQFVVERAHRVSMQPLPPGTLPRAFLIKLLNNHERDAALRAARKKGDIHFEGARISLYPDYSTAFQCKRSTYTGAKRRLLDLKIEYAMMFPAKFRVLDGKMLLYFDRPKVVADWLDSHAIHTNSNAIFA